MKNIKQPLIEKIAEANAEIAKLNIDFDTAKSVHDAAPSIKEIEAWMEYCNANNDAMSA